jgi:hypothetical protein
MERIEASILLLAIIFILAAVIYFLRKNIEHYYSDENYIKKNAMGKDQCERIIDVAKQMKFDTDPEPVDKQPVYQIDIFNDDDVLNEKLWKQCKPIYEAHKEIADSSDFMFLKRYTMNERRRLEAHSDRATYTVSVLLSDTRDFQGCEFFLFDKKSTEKIGPKYHQMDSKEKDKYISSLGKKLPILEFEQGDVLRFDSECLHGVTHLTGGERYLLTIFYGTK